MNSKTFSFQVGGREVTVETGKYAGQANGSCIIRCGDTVVMTNVTMADAPRPGMDYFPLGVDFEEKLYEEIHERYGEHIRQADTDDIAEQEVKFFIWARPEDWGFSVVPLYRRNRRLYLGKEEQFSFENDGWTQNFFDGMK